MQMTLYIMVNILYVKVPVEMISTVTAYHAGEMYQIAETTIQISSDGDVKVNAETYKATKQEALAAQGGGSSVTQYRALSALPTLSDPHIAHLLGGMVTMAVWKDADPKQAFIAHGQFKEYSPDDKANILTDTDYELGFNTTGTGPRLNSISKTGFAVEDLTLSLKIDKRNIPATYETIGIWLSEPPVRYTAKHGEMTVFRPQSSQGLQIALIATDFPRTLTLSNINAVDIMKMLRPLGAEPGGSAAAAPAAEPGGSAAAAPAAERTAARGAGVQVKPPREETGGGAAAAPEPAFGYWHGMTTIDVQNNRDAKLEGLDRIEQALVKGDIIYRRFEHNSREKVLNYKGIWETVRTPRETWVWTYHAGKVILAEDNACTIEFHDGDFSSHRWHPDKQRYTALMDSRITHSLWGARLTDLNVSSRHPVAVTQRAPEPPPQSRHKHEHEPDDYDEYLLGHSYGRTEEHKRQERMAAAQAEDQALQDQALLNARSLKQQREKEAHGRYSALTLEYTITPKALAPSTLYLDRDLQGRDLIIYEGNGDTSMHYVPFTILGKSMQEIWVGHDKYFFECLMNLATAEKEPQYVAFTLRGDALIGKPNSWTVLNTNNDETIRHVEIRYVVRKETAATERREVRQAAITTLRPNARTWRFL